ncbi:hypothetical protein [Sodalinema gerasimenkoae]|uniref:hypothetical protein n=1 Tax=Sodalinema gerasimenkoae TaxID=2862348 RepID=UPI00135CABE0|nr:hypothetical protein [Sodalinema gerasimenkoae]
MATFDSTGSSLSATTLEGALLEVSRLALKISEDGNAPAGFAGTLALSAANSTATLNFSVPVVESSTATSIELTAADLAGGDYTFTPPTAGDFVATNPMAALLELGKKINLLEKEQQTTPNRVQLSFNLDQGLGTLSLSLPVAIVAAPDGFAVEALEFVA